MTKYVCPHCNTEWTQEEIDKAMKRFEHISFAQMEEHEGCPECLHECDRCGMVKDEHGSLEHCL